MERSTKQEKMASLLEELAKAEMETEKAKEMYNQLELALFAKKKLEENFHSNPSRSRLRPLSPRKCIPTKTSSNANIRSTTSNTLLVQKRASNSDTSAKNSINQQVLNRILNFYKQEAIFMQNGQQGSTPRESFIKKLTKKTMLI